MEISATGSPIGNGFCRKMASIKKERTFSGPDLPDFLLSGHFAACKNSNSFAFLSTWPADSQLPIDRVNVPVKPPSGGVFFFGGGYPLFYFIFCRYFKEFLNVIQFPVNPRSGRRIHGHNRREIGFYRLLQSYDSESLDNLRYKA